MIIHLSLLSVVEMNTVMKNISLTIPSTVHDQGKSGQKFKHLQEAQRNTALWSALETCSIPFSNSPDPST